VEVAVYGGGGRPPRLWWKWLAAAPAVEGGGGGGCPREVERVSEKLGLELEVEMC
jgi:hypothetical protein